MPDRWPASSGTGGVDRGLPGPAGTGWNSSPERSRPAGGGSVRPQPRGEGPLTPAERSALRGHRGAAGRGRRRAGRRTPGRRAGTPFSGG
ncbi:hypothetical protein SUDANB126_03339 [Streptomyces sp. enrichment culture]